jgi:hypothetical protein
MIAAAWNAPLSAQQLRIETQVFVDDQTEPASHNVTLFDGSTVYDFGDESEQITVYRAATTSHASSFFLLDPRSKSRTEVSTERIAGLMKKLTRWAAEQEDEILKFSAAPEFEQAFDSETGLLTLSSPVWNYTAATVPAEDGEALARYREFTDWYTKLSTMLEGSLPPGARLELNAALSNHGVVPVEIRRTVKSESSALRSTHLFTWRLSREDRERIDQTRGYLASFKKVANKDFLARRSDEDVIRGQSR